MKLLRSGDGRIVKIIQKNKISSDIPVRLSSFVYPFEYKNSILLKNTLTKQVFMLSSEEWSALQTGMLPMEVRNELIRLHFLVGSDDNRELSEYNTVLSVLRIMQKKKHGIASYTILPTTGCNARCIYCYEEGWLSKTMSPQIADAVVDFICRTRQEGKIRLDWFGGEPLCGADTISRICRGVKNRGVDYFSTIITNGTLFTQNMVKEARDLWNLKRAQISMDGAKEDYKQRKNYAQPDLYNYETAMRGAELLSEAGVEVMMRCNYDAGNLMRVKEFFSDCKDRFGKRNNISFYMEQLFQYTSAEENAALFRASAEVSAYLDELGLKSTERIEQRLKTHYCMADSHGNSVIIDPEGSLHACEHDIEGKAFGTVFDHTINWLAVGEEIVEECRDCCFLPDCTPFRKSRCPLNIAACRTQMAIRTERSLVAMLNNSERKANDESIEEC